MPKKEKHISENANNSLTKQPTSACTILSKLLESNDTNLSILLKTKIACKKDMVVNPTSSFKVEHVGWEAPNPANLFVCNAQQRSYSFVPRQDSYDQLQESQQQEMEDCIRRAEQRTRLG